MVREFKFDITDQVSNQVPTDLSSEVLIPDANLRAKVQEAPRFSTGRCPHDKQAMAELTSANFKNSGIKDLTGLEHCNAAHGVISQFQ